MIDTTNKIIQKIEKHIFDYNINNFYELFPQLIDNIENILSYANFNELGRVNVTLERIEASLKNKDYLLAYDLIKFELAVDIDMITCP